jgi:hypothetical protein
VSFSLSSLSFCLLDAFRLRDARLWASSFWFHPRKVAPLAIISWDGKQVQVSLGDILISLTSAGGIQMLSKILLHKKSLFGFLRQC